MKKILMFPIPLLVLSVMLMSMPVTAYETVEFDNFGGYVRTMAKAGVADCLDQLGLDFGTIFVSPVSGEPQPMYVVEHPLTTDQCWILSVDFDEDGRPDYAAQWYTFVEAGHWGIPGHDYISIWCEDPVPDITPDWQYTFGSGIYPLSGYGLYYGYTFDVTD